jgi:hypothetical protein
MNKIFTTKKMRVVKELFLATLLSVAVYSFSNNFGDVRRGLKDGWNGKPVKEAVVALK